MQSNEPMEIIFQDVVMPMTASEQEQKAKELAAKKHMNRLIAGYDYFREVRKFVMENMHLMRGKTIPMEIDYVTYIDGTECIVLNDHYLITFDEAKDFIDEIIEKENHDIATSRAKLGHDPRELDR